MKTIAVASATFSQALPEIEEKIMHRVTQRSRSSLTATTHRSSLHTSNDNNSIGDSLAGSLGNSVGSVSLNERTSSEYHDNQLPDVHVLRRTDNGGYTAPTMFSVVSHSDKSSSRSLFRRDASNATSKSSLHRFFSKHGRRRNQLSEDQLRKQVTKYCERGNWSRVRKLISNHDFTETQEIILETSSNKKDGGSIGNAKGSSSESHQSSTNEPVQGITSRRPSYGSRNGDRLSFSGKESAAAAAMIKAAAAAAILEESSHSDEKTKFTSPESNVGENILHDVCRLHPPVDVMELLLVAMRHRRGSTCGRDEKGRTPLHVAVVSGASSGVIDALTRADPTPASMGDADKRSPLHLAVKILVHNERNLEQIEPLPRPQSSSQGMMSKLLLWQGHNEKGNVCSNAPILSQEEALEETRRIVAILKNAMITYPGPIDFKDEDNTGFAPLDYAIDGSMTDKIILRALIRRNKSQDLCRRSTLRSEASDLTQKTRNCFPAMFTKQANCESPLRHKRSSERFSMSSHESLHSQDSKIVQLIEEEEIAARRHRINRINVRKQKVVVQERLFDVFGIEGEDSPLDQPAVELTDEPHPRQYSRMPSQQLSEEEQKESIKSCHSDDKMENQSPNSSKASRALSFSMITQNHSEAAELASVQHCLQAEEEEDMSPPSTNQALTEEEIYNCHMQAYLENVMGDYLGDFEVCDDLDFLYDDPDEMDEYTRGAEGRQPKNHGTQDDTSQDENGVPIFEFCLSHCREDSPLDFDECSEITYHNH